MDEVSDEELQELIEHLNNPIYAGTKFGRARIALSHYRELRACPRDVTLRLKQLNERLEAAFKEFKS